MSVCGSVRAVYMDTSHIHLPRLAKNILQCLHSRFSPYVASDLFSVKRAHTQT